MASTAPVITPLAAVPLQHCHSITAKMKAPDDDDVHDEGVGMFVLIVAASGTIAFVPVTRYPSRLVDNRYPVAIPPPLSI
jgi:hypothetical protein